MIYPLIFCPSIEGGGVEKNLFLVSNYLSKKIEKVYVLTANTEASINFNKNIIFISPETKYWSNKNRFIKSLICLYLFFFLKKKFLIISFQSNIMAIIIATLFRSKVIIRSNTSPKKYINNFLKKKLFTFIFKIADHVIVNSYDFKKKFLEIFNINSKVIYNILPESSYRKKYINKKKEIKIITVGRLTDQKNHILLLNALSKLNKEIKWKLDIIGKGYNYNLLQQFILEKKLTKKIKLLGYKKNPEFFMFKSDLFILTSEYEGLPNVLIEAQQIGLPIISTNCHTGPREILMNGKLGDLIPQNNIKALQNKIEQFYYNRNLLNYKSREAFKHLYRFDHNKNCEEYHKLILKYLADEAK